MSLRKTRPVDNPYETWYDPTSGWTWKVLKFYKSRANTIADPYGRVYCRVNGDFNETGDVYYSEVTGRGNHTLVQANYGE
jgi:hypothetical protein